MHFPAFWLEVISAIALSAHFHAGQLVFLRSWDLPQKLQSWTKSCLPLLSGLLSSRLSCECWLPPVSPTDLWRLDVTLSMCAPAISFVCLQASSCARQMSTAFCRSSVFSRRSSSCTLSVTENTILSRNILSLISPKLHKFARDLKSVRNELKGSWYVMFQNRCVSMTSFDLRLQYSASLSRTFCGSSLSASSVNTKCSYTSCTWTPAQCRMNDSRLCSLWFLRRPWSFQVDVDLSSPWTKCLCEVCICQVQRRR